MTYPIPTPSPDVARYPELRGGVAIVTGAARGIGRGIASRLAREGMRLVVSDIDGPALEQTTGSLRERGTAVHPVLADLSGTEGVDLLLEETAAAFGRVDLLVNNAADLRRARTLEPHDDLLEHQLATNVRGPYRCAVGAAVLMRRDGGGSIVNLSSVGALRAHQRGLPYDMTKGAINAMTLAMAVDLGEYGIRVNAIAPGVTSTSRGAPDPASARETAARIPLGRAGTPSDIAALVAFLASPDAAYITGQVISVDGGITSQLSPRGRDGLEAGDRMLVPDERIEPS